MESSESEEEKLTPKRSGLSKPKKKALGRSKTFPDSSTKKRKLESDDEDEMLLSDLIKEAKKQSLKTFKEETSSKTKSKQ